MRVIMWCMRHPSQLARRPPLLPLFRAAGASPVHDPSSVSAVQQRAAVLSPGPSAVRCCCCCRHSQCRWCPLMPPFIHCCWPSAPPAAAAAAAFPHPHPCTSLSERSPHDADVRRRQCVRASCRAPCSGAACGGRRCGRERRQEEPTQRWWTQASGECGGEKLGGRTNVAVKRGI